MSFSAGTRTAVNGVAKEGSWRFTNTDDTYSKCVVIDLHLVKDDDANLRVIGTYQFTGTCDSDDFYSLS